MKITRRQLRQLINEEAKRSEMAEFGGSRSGGKVRQAGQRVSSAAGAIAEVAKDQTGSMARALENISEFVGKMGETLSSVGVLEEGESLTSRMPTANELKNVTKAIKKLEG
tara:strand:- start:534 stop:866 length:333 start_codon:yes stop_codon:yes gene_type:complete